jgi:hypothetical protein
MTWKRCKRNHICTFNYLCKIVEDYYNGNWYFFWIHRRNEKVIINSHFWHILLVELELLDMIIGIQSYKYINAGKGLSDKCGHPRRNDPLYTEDHRKHASAPLYRTRRSPYPTFSLFTSIRWTWAIFYQSSPISFWHRFSIRG